MIKITIIVKVLFLVFVAVVLVGCGRNMESNKVLGAKAQAYGEIICKDSQGLYELSQILYLDWKLDGYVGKIEIVCYNGYTQVYEAKYIEKENSTRVAEILKIKQ